MRIGSLFSGYGGLDMGVQAVLGGDVAWHVEFDAAPSKILEQHWPGVPNYGDITKVDFAQVEPVDIITGGFPCQDLSLAGRRAGMRPGTRSGLWADFLRAIDTIRPRLAVIENVRGLLSGCAESDSDLEPCPGCLGESDIHRPVLRALGRVLGDLADIGYDAEWVGLRAADAGAPHGRFRVFVLAYPSGARRAEGEDAGTGSSDASSRSRGLESERGGGERAALQDADRAACGERRIAAPGQAEGGRARSNPGRRGGTSAADACCDESERRRVARDVGGAESSDEGESEERQWVRDTAGDSRSDAWGEYEPAVRRWEVVTGHHAPAPTVGGRLSPAFVEWMMGLPEGHVTSVDITRAQQLKALGNGVVPQQAALALSLLLSHSKETTNE